MKKFRPILGISLLVQSITFFVLYLVNVEKKKNLAKAFAAFAAIGGVSGAVLLYAEYKERKMLKDFDAEEYYDDFDEFLDDLDDIDVSEDDIACSFENTEE
ncbi:MAG: hypothetical protein IKC39_02500 [Clostridia bacterium]|nr:hypothetical protein [Clostridia bacterium]MBR6754328.1 hypothetical protein [Clostridia bacterium]